MGGGAKKPKETAADKALKAAQIRSLEKTEEEINERKRRTLRSQYSGRGSLLSGGARGIRPGETRPTRLAPSGPTAAPPSRPPAPTRRGSIYGRLQSLTR